MKVVLLTALGIICAASSVAVHAEDVQEHGLFLDLTCTLPADGPEIDSGTLVARLYEYDPMLADASAIETAKIVLTGLTHREGKDTVVRIPLHGKATPQRQHYVSVLVYPGRTPNEQQRLYFIDGFQTVFEDKTEQKLNLTLTPAGKKNGAVEPAALVISGDAGDLEK